MRAALQPGQVLAEPVERALVEVAVVLEPGADVGERGGSQVRRPLLRAAAARHQARSFEHLEVLAHRLQRDRREQRGDLVDGRVALGQPGEDGPAGRVGERPERDAQRVVVRGGRHRQALARVSSTMPEGAVRLSVTVNSLGVPSVNSRRPSPSTTGQMSSRYSSIRPAARRVSVSCPLP